MYRHGSSNGIIACMLFLSQGDLGHSGKESFNFSDNFLRLTFATQEKSIEKSSQIGGVMGGQLGGQMNYAIDNLDQLTHR